MKKNIGYLLSIIMIINLILITPQRVSASVSNLPYTAAGFEGAAFTAGTMNLKDGWELTTSTDTYGTNGVAGIETLSSALGGGKAIRIARNRLTSTTTADYRLYRNFTPTTNNTVVVTYRILATDSLARGRVCVFGDSTSWNQVLDVFNLLPGTTANTVKLDIGSVSYLDNMPINKWYTIQMIETIMWHEGYMGAQGYYDRLRSGGIYDDTGKKILSYDAKPFYGQKDPITSAVTGNTTVNIKQVRVEPMFDGTTLPSDGLSKPCYVDDFTVTTACTPVASGINVSKSGDILTANYTFTSDFGYTEQTSGGAIRSTFQWYQAPNDSDVFTAITGANQKTFSLTNILPGNKLKVEVVPVDIYGNIGQIASTVANGLPAPKVDNVSIQGKPYAGETITGAYDFTDYDANNVPIPNAVDSSSYRWLQSTNGLTYTAISGETGKTLLLKDVQLDKYIRFEVTPKNVSGVSGVLKTYDLPTTITPSSFRVESTNLINPQNKQSILYLDELGTLADTQAVVDVSNFSGETKNFFVNVKKYNGITLENTVTSEVYTMSATEKAKVVRISAPTLPANKTNYKIICEVINANNQVVMKTNTINQTGTAESMIVNDLPKSILQPVKYEAESYTSSLGGVVKDNRVAQSGGYIINATVDKQYVKYRGTDLNGVSGITLRVSSRQRGGFVEVRAGAADGRLLKKISIPRTTVWIKGEADTSNYRNNTTDVDFVMITESFDDMPYGIEDLYLVFRGDVTPILSMDYFELNRIGLPKLSGAGFDFQYKPLLAEGSKDSKTVQYYEIDTYVKDYPKTFSSGLYQGSVDLYNNTDQPRNIILTMAVYDDNKLVGVYINNVDQRVIPAHTSQNISVSANLNIPTNQDGYVIKLHMWDTLQSTIPLTTSEVFTSKIDLKFPKQDKIYPANSNVAIIGDSISRYAAFDRLWNEYYTTRFPDRNVTFTAFGRSGATSMRGQDMLAVEVFQRGDYNKAIVTMAVNDANTYPYQSGNVTDQNNIKSAATTAITNLLTDMNSRGLNDVIYCTPYGGDPDLSGTYRPSSTEGYQMIVDIIKSIATPKGYAVYSAGPEMTLANNYLKRNKPTPTFTSITSDGIHPTDDGHYIMGYTFLKQMGVPAEVATTSIDGEKGQLKSVSNADITGLTKTGTDISYNYRPYSLPLAVVGSYTLTDSIMPLTKNLNQELIKISGLAIGNYKLTIDNTVLGTYSDIDFAKGVNIATNSLYTGQIKAKEVRVIVDARWTADVDLNTKRTPGTQYFVLDSAGVATTTRYNAGFLKYFDVVTSGAARGAFVLKTGTAGDYKSDSLYVTSSATGKAAIDSWVSGLATESADLTTIYNKTIEMYNASRAAVQIIHTVKVEKVTQ